MANSSAHQYPPSAPSLPWKTRISVSLISFVTDTARRRNGTINRRLLRLFDLRSPPSSTARGGVSTSDFTLDSSRNLWFRIFVPTSSSATAAPKSLPVVLFFHGGGFAFLSPDSFAYDAVCRKLARETPSVVISVNYRLSPEHRYPCQYDDGFDVLRFLDGGDDGGALPGAADVSKCFLAGDSAGANLAHHVAVRATKGRESFRAAKVLGVISIQPFFGGEERTEAEIRLARAPVVSVDRTDWMWKAFLPEESDRDHEAANVSGPKGADVSGLEHYPKTLVFIGGLDPLQDWQRRYYQWLKKSGKVAELIEYPTMIHAFYVFPELPESHQLISQVKDFVANCISSSDK
ncbi:Arylacetamide deacetylase [Parasponia andersonii]|uniref:Arylacetamide deacetylase n=1 Tax=Parasponia andersonii TaxID=3476 RepID=A0A2P5A9S8_PARAD|nr:Arylacetamide deacetylase [Parasponia andersonii]